MVLAAAVRADAGVAAQRREAPAVLDAGVVAGGVEAGPDVGFQAGCFVSAADAHERRRDRDDERARTAHAGGARQIAREHDVGAERRAGKVAREATDRDLDVVPPAAVPSGQPPDGPTLTLSPRHASITWTTRSARGAGGDGESARQRAARACGRRRSRCACRTPRGGRAPTRRAPGLVRAASRAARRCRCRATAWPRARRGVEPAVDQRARRVPRLSRARRDPGQPSRDVGGIGAARQIEHRPARRRPP